MDVEVIKTDKPNKNNTIYPENTVKAKYTDKEGGAGTNYGALSLMIQAYFKLILMLVLLERCLIILH